VTMADDSRDKVHISSYYDEAGRCNSIDVCLNYDAISREDLAETIRMVFQPGVRVVDGPPLTPFRHTELGGTRPITKNHPPNGALPPVDASTIPASATTTRMTINLSDR
jgi:hypothetical protein